MPAHHLMYCSANRVGGGHWSVGGSLPSLQDRSKDQVHVFAYVLGYNKPKLEPVKELVSCAAGGYDSKHQWLVDHGYLSPYFRRANETLERTAERRHRTARSRLRNGLPVSIPNAVGLAAKH